MTQKHFNITVYTIVAIISVTFIILLSMKLKNIIKALKYRHQNITNNPSNTMQTAIYYSDTRGYRNNNPLNLRISNNDWTGKVPIEQNTDGAFEQFITMPYGFRAAMKNIRTLVSKYDCSTIQKLINRWAPESDGNNPQRYATRVANRTGYATDAPIKTHDKDFMCHLVFAMAEVENGTLPLYTDIQLAYDLL